MPVDSRRRAFPPHERARVSSILTVPAVLAPASGPLIGGYLLQIATWRALFWLNVPIGLLLLIASALWLREQPQDHPGRFDPRGFVLAAAGLAALLFGLARAGERGLADPGALAFTLGGAATLAAFVAAALLAFLAALGASHVDDGLAADTLRPTTNRSDRETRPMSGSAP